MKFNLSYVLAGMMALNTTGAKSNVVPDYIPYDISTPVKFTDVLNNGVNWGVDIEEMNHQLTQQYLDDKSDKLCEIYINNMLAARQRIAPTIGTKAYRAAVRRELPGAPVGKHCVYGQYTQLSRALDEMGDTISVVPDGARYACLSFKNKMRQHYNNDDYAGCIYEGKMYKSDAEYNAALQQYLAARKIDDKTSADVRARAVADFSARNFSVESLSAGAMLIVPRTRNSRNAFHMIMLLGRGRMENNKFIPDENGEWLYAGHNRESVGDLFRTWDTSRVFASNTKNIVRTKYAQEIDAIRNKTTAELIDYLSTGADKKQKFAAMSHAGLVHLACNKYFDKHSRITNVDSPGSFWAWAPVTAMQRMHQHTL